MSARGLRTLVRIEKPKPSATEGAHGHIDLSDDANWVRHCDRRAECTVVGSRELVTNNNQVRSFTTWRIRLRNDPLTRLILTRMRVVFLEEERVVHIEQSYQEGRDWLLFGVEQAFDVERTN